jgi:hypothetical protein
VDKTRRLLIKKVDRTLDAKIFVISMNANFTLLAKHMFNDYSNDIMEHFNGEQLEHIYNKFYELSSPNVCNFVASFKHHLGGGHIDNIFELKSKSHYDYIQECCFLRQVLGQMCSFSRR